MAVLVRNETGKDFGVATGHRRSQVLKPGIDTVITDLELESIPIKLRGAGAINVLDLASEEPTDKITLLDYFVFNAAFQTRYVGTAKPGSNTADPVWRIKRFTYETLGPADARIQQVEAMTNVSWNQRDSLPWAA